MNCLLQGPLSKEELGMDAGEAALVPALQGLVHCGKRPDSFLWLGAMVS